ncbi:MAG: glycyl-radical enzyme activating protein, partial [Abditibacteriota bacterium]|nr:glycyl-radical enzyme activating protein [Abditibacteriota bacterium]
METTGRLFNIQKFSIHDGPGIRTTVFLKGCPLSCKWCHNPESISPEPSLAFYDFRCAGCGECVKACPAGAMKPGAFDRSLCAACGKCVGVCAYGARELFGYEDTAENVMRTVMEDEIFYETSGGGMTISGGEPFYQPEFTLALLQAAKERGLDT